MAPDYVWIEGWSAIGEELDRVIAAVSDRGQPVVIYVPTSNFEPDRWAGARLLPDRVVDALERLLAQGDREIEDDLATLTDRLDDLEIRYEVARPSQPDADGGSLAWVRTLASLAATPLLVPLLLPLSLLSARVDRALWRAHRRSGSTLPLRVASLLRRPLFAEDPTRFARLSRAIETAREETGRDPLVVTATPEVVRRPDLGE